MSLDQDWTPVRDDSNRLYFWNTRTDETSWRAPSRSVHVVRRRPAAHVRLALRVALDGRVHARISSSVPIVDMMWHALRSEKERCMGDLRRDAVVSLVFGHSMREFENAFRSWRFATILMLQEEEQRDRVARCRTLKSGRLKAPSVASASGQMRFPRRVVSDERGRHDGSAADGVQPRAETTRCSRGNGSVDAEIQTDPLVNARCAPRTMEIDQDRIDDAMHMIEEYEDMKKQTAELRLERDAAWRVCGHSMDLARELMNVQSGLSGRVYHM